MNIGQLRLALLDYPSNTEVYFDSPAGDLHEPAVHRFGARGSEIEPEFVVITSDAPEYKKEAGR